MRRALRRGAEEGQASLLLLALMALSLLAVTVLLIRLGDAQESQTQAQRAADAAALAGAADYRDRAARSIAGGFPPGDSFQLEPARNRARTYAALNDAELLQFRASDDDNGFTGDTVRVEVRSAQCQRELDEDGSWEEWSDWLCEDEEGTAEGNVASEAAAIATVEMPDCELNLDPNQPMVCDGTPVTDYATAQELIEIHLVDEEGDYLYHELDPDEL
ncbi:pilus assembly protein TadG-related protein [Lipingzhangella sp. LS1_29]|uniref:Pilus assembly protein TadG-related protein n=1 Tax=Lipingzhangella rawalii TaxID=2055835 RepID=A0ABU2H6L5_9ACTN|nr:pilus assembly protein TadG-related protein [Lipingzhangella rawalii]MDS1270943.1 pilus assembly protein TadG-related protein [Lipingzhangella rawalii]